MSTGKRLAKRSIIGTRVCALGTDGFYYAGVIQAVKSQHNSNAVPSFMRTPLGPPTDPALVSTSNSGNMYAVRFDVKRNAVGPGGVAIHPGVPQNREFRDVDLIGPGFRNILDCTLKRGQKVFVTHNGRECNAEVVEHDIVRDEVTIKIVALGHEVSFGWFLGPGDRQDAWLARVAVTSESEWSFPRSSDAFPRVESLRGEEEAWKGVYTTQCTTR